MIGRSPEFLVAHRAGRPELLLLVLVTLSAPLPVLLLIWLVGRVVPRAQRPAAAVILVLLCAALSVQILKQLGLDAWLFAVPLALAMGMAGSMAYQRFAAIRAGATVLGVAIIVVPAVFLTRPEVRKLMASSEVLVDAPDPRRPGFRPAPVVFVVFDELPLLSLLDAHGRIDPDLYPELAAFAHEAVWFRNATTVHDYTRWALPAVLTGRLPPPAAVPTPADHPDTLFALLRHTHRMRVVEAVTDLCPRSVCPTSGGTTSDWLLAISRDLVLVLAYLLTPKDLHDGLPELSGDWAGFASVDDPRQSRQKQPVEPWRRRWHRKQRESNLGQVLAFMDGFRESDPQPTFYFLHTLLSHHPYHYLPDGRRHASSVLPPGAHPGKGIDDEWALAQNQQRQLLQTGFIDTIVGRLLDRIKAAGIYDDALIIVTSDHGVSFQAGEPLRSFTEANAAEIMRVPLFVKFPSGISLPESMFRTNSAGQRFSDRNVELVDIAPTIMDVLGLPAPPRSEGASLLDPSIPERPVKRIAFNNGRSVRTYGPEGPSVERVLRRKIAWFNGSSNYRRIPRHPRFEWLVGRRVSDFRVEERGGGAQIRDPELHAAFDPDAEILPLGIGGRIRGRPAGSPPADLAIAMNGVIRAVTSTWVSRPNDWFATPPASAWRRGHNDIEVLEIDGSQRPPVLTRLLQLTRRPEDLNLISPAARTRWDVRVRGFFPEETAAGGPFRWTRQRASLSVATFGLAPRAVTIDFIRTAAPDALVSIAVNACQLFEGPLPHRNWRAKFSLEQCDLRENRVTITLTTTKTARGARDRRDLGAAVRRIVLE